VQQRHRHYHRHSGGGARPASTRSIRML
jgi:hypothetical protein